MSHGKIRSQLLPRAAKDGTITQAEMKQLISTAKKSGHAEARQLIDQALSRYDKILSRDAETAAREFLGLPPSLTSDWPKTLSGWLFAGEPAPWVAPAQRQAFASYRLEIDALKESGALGAVTVGGKSIPRIADRPRPPTSFQQSGIDSFFRRTVEDPPPEVKDWKNFRSASAAKKAVAAPPVKGADGQPKRLGELTIVRTGIGNCIPSPAQIFRMAQHSGKLVVSYANPHPPEKAKLRPLAEVGGVPVPASLRGKLFAVGSPDRATITFEQASDVFLEQIEEMHQDARLLGLDVLSSGATVVAHSQGPLDAVLTRQRLIEAGHTQAIGRVVSLGGTFKGSAIVDSNEGVQYLAGAYLLSGDQGLRTVASLRREYVESIFTDDLKGLVDLAVVGNVTAPVPFGASHNVRPTFRWLSSVISGSGLGEDNDGLATRDSAEFGKAVLRIERPCDHVGLIADPAVIDDVLRQLP